MKVFVSFDYENDRRYKYLLDALIANRSFDFSYEDFSSQEINSHNIGTVKAALSRKIHEADCTLVIVGQYANSQHRDQNLIGYRNWQNFEIAKSKEYGNKLVGVKIDRSYTSPDELLNSGANWAMSFTVEDIKRTLGV